MKYDNYESMLCVHLYPIKENYVLAIDVAGATDGEGMVTKEGTGVHNISTWQVQPTAKTWLLRKERPVFDISTWQAQLMKEA